MKIQALALNDPVFGEKTPTVQTEKPLRKPQTSATFMVHTAGQKEECPVCREHHAIRDCSRLAQMSVEGRSKEVLRLRLCFNCLKHGHQARECRSRQRCGEAGCGRKHNTLLHRDRPPTRQPPPQQTHSQKPEPQQQQSRPSPPPVSTAQDAQETVATNTYIDSHGNGARGRRSLLPIVAVYVRASRYSAPIKTYALLDSGSTHSFCSESLISELRPPTRKEEISLTTLHQVKQSLETKSTTLYVSDTSGGETVVLQTVYSKENLPIPVECIARKGDLEEYAHLHGLEIPMVDGKEVTLLIGQDVPEALTPQLVMPGGQGEPYAVRTRLGWTINGPIGAPSEDGKVVSGFVQVSGHGQSKSNASVQQAGGDGAPAHSRMEPRKRETSSGPDVSRRGPGIMPHTVVSSPGASRHAGLDRGGRRRDPCMEGPSSGRDSWGQGCLRAQRWAGRRLSDQHGVVRQPRGPDGTPGFMERRGSRLKEQIMTIKQRMGNCNAPSPNCAIWKEMDKTS